MMLRRFVTGATLVCAAFVVACTGTVTATPGELPQTGQPASSGGGTLVDAARAADSGRKDAGAAVDATSNSRCGGRVCGDDGAGGSCGNCTAGDICSGSGQCEEECPLPGRRSSGYPARWREGQCVVKWDNSQLPANEYPPIRAHYDGNALYAQVHPVGSSAPYWVGADTLSNLQLPFEQFIRFCKSQPLNGQCQTYSEPTCSGIKTLNNCQEVTRWQCGNCPGQNQPVRIRITTDGIRWTEMQDKNSGSWNFVPGGNALQMGPWPVSLEPYSNRCLADSPPSTSSPACP